MISYKPFWAQMKEKGITQYDLQERLKIGNSLLDKLRHNKAMNTTTLDRLCKQFNCRLDEIAEYKPEEE